jgi:hypothetical protein
MDIDRLNQKENVSFLLDLLFQSFTFTVLVKNKIYDDMVLSNSSLYLQKST